MRQYCPIDGGTKRVSSLDVFSPLAFAPTDGRRSPVAPFDRFPRRNAIAGQRSGSRPVRARRGAVRREFEPVIELGSFDGRRRHLRELEEYRLVQL